VPSECRYALKVEEHLYRIVQQACENAFRHAHSERIRISGCLEPNHVEIAIEDNGIGFELEQLDFTTLLAEKHFGLAGMFERADLIGAEIKFNSTAGQGTLVTISWKSNSAGEI